MATLYNKTALNKIKKAELIQMFIEQQGHKKKLKEQLERWQEVAGEWETEYCRMESNFESLECDNKELKEEIKELKESKQIEFTEENMKIQESLDGWMATLEEYKMLKVENEKLKEDLEWNKHEVVRYSVALEEEYVLKDEYEKLKSLVRQYKESSLVDCDATPDEITEAMEDYEEKIETLEDKIEELKKQNDYAYKQINELMSKVTLLSTD